MPAPLLGELLGKSKMGARLAANLAMGSTPKSKAGAAASPLSQLLALGDGAAAVATVPPPAREAASTMGGGGGGFSCVSCGAEDASAFSKRMLNKRGRHGDRVRPARASRRRSRPSSARPSGAAPRPRARASARSRRRAPRVRELLAAAAGRRLLGGELDADDGDATCLRCEGAPVGLYDGDVRGGENAWLAERQQKRRPPA